MFFKILQYLILSCFVFLSQLNLNGQSKEGKHHYKLRKNQKEILNVEKEISAKKKKESSELYLLTNLDLEIDLTQSIIQDIKNETNKKEKQIAQIEKNHKKTQKELQRLKEILTKRLVYFYKYGRTKDLELLFTARSFNQGILWVEYQKRLSAQDHRNYLKIKEKEAQLARDKNLLSIELSEKKKLLTHKLKEEENLKKKVSERKTVLASIRKNTDLLRQELKAKEQSAVEIRNLIVQLDKAVISRPLIETDTPFSELRGRMVWPTHGKVISKFGKFRHPELKTITENLGIDIQAPMGKPVQVVAKGRVTKMEWQRGRGHIIIVSH